MSDALYIPDENKDRAQLRYQQARSRLVEMGNEISRRKRSTSTVAARTEARPVEAERSRVTRSNDDKVVAFTSVLRPAKRRRPSFLKTGLWRY